MTVIKENQEYFGSMIHEWTTEHKNVYVITGSQQGGSTIDQRVGRVAQVRLEAGDFGSDKVFLRHCDDSLVHHNNQSFWLIPDKFKSYLDKCFKDSFLDDSDKYDYTIGGKESEKGFIIKSKIKDGKTTPMRNINNAIKRSLSNLMEDQ